MAEATKETKGAQRTPVLLELFYHMRSCGLRVTPTQWLTVLEGAAKGLHGSSLMGFYGMARAILVKDERELDDFDQAFASYFEGRELRIEEIENRVLDWLARPIPPFEIDPELRRVMDEVDVEALREELNRRLAEQKEKHDGGNHWVGTGGTSPFGHSGYHPGGIRVGGQGRLGSAVQVAAARSYRGHRQDVALDVRQLTVALRKLRVLVRSGPGEELDMEETIARTARSGGDLELAMRSPRKNDIAVILAMDVGGSMEPHRRLVDRLFSAAHQARHFRKFEHVYFHNCVYDAVYEDPLFERAISVRKLIADNDSRTRLIVVGDAYMYPGELIDRYGAIAWDDRNEEPGITWLRRLAEHFPRSAWLNPMPPWSWRAPSVGIVRKVFEMYPLTALGVERLAEDLAG